MDQISPDHSPSARPRRRSKSVHAPIADQLYIGISRDPVAASYVMGVRGSLSTATIANLAVAFATIDDGCGLHVDVTNVGIDDADVLRQLESLVDQLEQRCVRLRMVGFDPHHPAI